MYVGPIGFQATHGGENTLQINDKKGTTRVILGVTSGGSSGLSIFGDGGRAWARILIEPSGSPSITLFDEDEKVLWQAPAK